MKAVAFWDAVPTRRALLDARVASGWVPRPSPLAEGPRVLGYAECLGSGASE